MYNFIFFVLYLCLFLNHVLCDPRATQAALICSNETASMSERQTFVSNFVTAIDRVTPLVGSQGYAAVVNGTGTNTTVYAFGECMKDLSRTDCDLCFAKCKTQILNCLPYQKGTIGGRLFYDGCYLRYDDHYFFNQTLSPQDKTVCGNSSFNGNQTNFRANAMELVRNLSMEAPKNDGFFVGMVNRENIIVYGLAQCWEFVNGSACELCLNKTVTQIDSCGAKEEGRVLNAGCYLRYSTHKFYYNSTGPRVLENGGVFVSLILSFSW